ncbi:MAG TPA: protein kinase [Candidatus Krumholzibacteria bacterium]|nr:protein kinase [Candidatus Krumholzibacteria bacterium]
MEPGRILAHYELRERIGKGGMGEVYRARDTKLGRDVALKLLPPEYAADPDRLARFEREAKVLASLNHPNIASIFGFEKTDDAVFLVMELVDGDDLAEVLRKGALPVDDAVNIARQIAEGLEEAHEKGIVHRDLKPANVKRTPEGKVKVLDFGLARAYAGQSAGEEAISSAPTMTAAMTQVGAVIGTAAYMSPEQARGKEVDRRADIWAFGVILFEMLTGKQAFVGETASDTLAGILKSEPEWSAVPADLPFQVERVLRRCLAKDPRQRLRDIGEARVRLEDPDAESGLLTRTLAAAAPAARPHLLLRAVPWALAACGVAIAAWSLVRGGGDGDARPLHLALPSPPGVVFHLSGSFPGSPELSPDGERMAFCGVDEETGQIDLYIRSIHDPQAVKVPDSRDAQYPFWSADGNWVAFYDREKGLMKAPARGGPNQKICAAGNGKGGSWNLDGDVLLTLDYNTPIFVAPAAGGEPRPVTDLENDKGFNSHRHPQFLPDGKHFLYFARSAGRADSEIRMASLDGDPTVVVMKSETMGFYASGHLLYVRDGDLFAQAMDAKTGHLSGPTRPLASGVMFISGAGKSAFSVSENGEFTYMRGKTNELSGLVWKDRRGAAQGPVADEDLYGLVSVSRDARYVAAAVTTNQTGTWDLWVVDVERNFRTKFTTNPSDENTPVWSHDSRTLYFTSDRAGKYDVYRKSLGSPDEPELVYDGRTSDLRLYDVTSDGRTLIFAAGSGTSQLDLFAVDLDDTTKVRTIRSTPATDTAAVLSPDGRWIAFASQESGRPQVFIAPWPALAPLVQVSTTSGTWSAWTKGGRELIYQEAEGDICAVALDLGGAEPRIGTPEVLFHEVAANYEGATWSVTPDGERFAVIDVQTQHVPEYANLVLGWPSMVQEER